MNTVDEATKSSACWAELFVASSTGYELLDLLAETFEGRGQLLQPLVTAARRRRLLGEAHQQRRDFLLVRAAALEGIFQRRQITGNRAAAQATDPLVDE